MNTEKRRGEEQFFVLCWRDQSVFCSFLCLMCGVNVFVCLYVLRPTVDAVRSLVGLFCFSFRFRTVVADFGPRRGVNYYRLQAVPPRWSPGWGSVAAPSRTETTQSGCACVPSVSRAPAMIQ